MHSGRLVVAVPVKDEAECLGACLEALTRQDIAADLTILALVNNSSDDSAAIARGFGPQVLVEEVTLSEADANAGNARRLAMQMAADIAGADGTVLTTDADGRVMPNWLRATLQAIHAGADVVAGRALIDPVDERRIPLALREADARECQYAALLDEIAAAIDPDPDDPWPRHDEHSGASIAVKVDAFLHAGGVPKLPMGEDRALVRNLRRIDARVRHAPDVQVVVSGRTEGRATGGMADTIRRRMVCPDMFLDDRLEGAREAMLRSRLRRRARLLWAEGAADFWAVLALARDLNLPASSVREKLASPWFGAAWDDLEIASSVLRRSPVPAANVGDEIALATALLNARRAPSRGIDQALGISA
jgi:GT2 family glycosyltransferase